MSQENIENYFSNPLFEGVNDNRDLGYFSRVLEDGVDIESPSPMTGLSILSLTTVSPTLDGTLRRELIQLLLEKGANLEHECHLGGTPLCHATELGDIQTVQLLLDAGANISHRTHNTGLTPFLIAATSSQDTELIDLLLNNGADINDTTTEILTPQGVEHSRNAFFCACGSNSSVLIVEKLLSIYGHKIIDASLPSGITPLMAAAKCNPNKDVVRFLLDKGANKSLVSQTGKTAFEYAKESNVDFGDIYIRLALDVAAQISTDVDIWHAITNSDLESIKFLISNGLDVEQVSEGGVTVFQYSFFHWLSTVMEMVTDENGQLSNTTAPEAAFAIVHYIANNTVADINALLPERINPLLPEGEQHTMLNLYVFLEGTFSGQLTRTMSQAWVMDLLRLGANPNAPSGNDSNNALMTACSAGASDELICILLNSGVDINAINSAGTTALMYAIKEKRNFFIIQQMIDKGANPYAAKELIEDYPNEEINDLVAPHKDIPSCVREARDEAFSFIDTLRVNGENHLSKEKIQELIDENIKGYYSYVYGIVDALCQKRGLDDGEQSLVLLVVPIQLLRPSGIDCTSLDYMDVWLEANNPESSGWAYRQMGGAMYLNNDDDPELNYEKDKGWAGIMESVAWQALKKMSDWEDLA